MKGTVESATKEKIRILMAVKIGEREREGKGEGMRERKAKAKTHTFGGKFPMIKDEIPVQSGTAENAAKFENLSQSKSYSNFHFKQEKDSIYRHRDCSKKCVNNQITTHTHTHVYTTHRADVRIQYVHTQWFCAL